MLTTFALLAALSTPIGHAGGLTISNVRQTWYLLGPTRTDDKVIPGDSYHIAFDIDGIKAAGNGKVQYAMGLEVINSSGKVEFGSQPTPKEVYNALGGSTVPAYANVDIGLNQAPGQYTLKVTVVDTKTNAKETLTRQFEVLKKDFGLVRLFTTADGDKVPCGPIGIPGQSLYVHFFAVGFELNQMKQPDLSIEMKIMDESGKVTLEEPFKEAVKPPAGQSGALVAIPLIFTLHLNRPGKFTAEFMATDKVSKKTAKLSLPILVLDTKAAR
jgi:hypothetical protein